MFIWTIYLSVKFAMTFAVDLLNDLAAYSSATSSKPVWGGFKYSKHERLCRNNFENKICGFKCLYKYGLRILVDRKIAIINIYQNLKL